MAAGHNPRSDEWFLLGWLGFAVLVALPKQRSIRVVGWAKHDRTRYSAMSVRVARQQPSWHHDVIVEEEYQFPRRPLETGIPSLGRSMILLAKPNNLGNIGGARIECRCDGGLRWKDRTVIHDYYFQSVGRAQIARQHSTEGACKGWSTIERWNYYADPHTCS
jgi:hypothetical protein